MRQKGNPEKQIYPDIQRNLTIVSEDELEEIKNDLKEQTNTKGKEKEKWRNLPNNLLKGKNN